MPNNTVWTIVGVLLIIVLLFFVVRFMAGLA